MREGDWRGLGGGGEGVGVGGRSGRFGAGEESWDGAGKVSVRNALEWLGFPDGGTEGDLVVGAERGEGDGRSDEVVEGSVGGGEINDVLCDVTAVRGESVFSGERAEIGDGAGEGLAGVLVEWARDDLGGGGDLGVLNGADFVVEGGKDGVAEGAEGAVSGVSCLEGLETVVGKSGGFGVVLGLPEGEGFIKGEELDIGAVGVGGANGVKGVKGAETGCYG